MQQNNIFDIIIVGGGAVGLFAMSKFLSAGFGVALFEGSIKLGGQCNLYLDKEIHNIPLYNKITANNLIKKLVSDLSQDNIFQHTKVFEVEKNDNINDVNADNAYVVKTNNGNFFCRYVILACGNGSISPNRLPLENAKAYEKKSIFYNVDNKEKFKNKDIVIAGGGDACIDWAIQLTDVAKSISIVHRRDITATDNPDYKIFYQFCQNGKIKTYFSYSIVDVVGDKNEGKLTGITIKNQQDNEITIKCDNMLVFYGLKSEQILKNTNLQNVNQATMETSMGNIFAVGDYAKYEGKLRIIPIGFSEVLKCFHAICQREKNGINMYGKTAQ